MPKWELRIEGIMDKEELLDVLVKTNKKRKNPVDEQVLKSILSIVIMNPLEENRGKSQEQIHYILCQMKEQQR
jgi:hypothetical protein